MQTSPGFDSRDYRHFCMAGVTFVSYVFKVTFFVTRKWIATDWKQFTPFKGRCDVSWFFIYSGVLVCAFEIKVQQFSLFSFVKLVYCFYALPNASQWNPRKGLISYFLEDYEVHSPVSIVCPMIKNVYSKSKFGFASCTLGQHNWGRVCVRLRHEDLIVCIM